MTSKAVSNSLYERAVKVLPGGVNSPVRAFKQVGGTPLFMRKGDGAYCFDADSNAYIDYVGSWGPLILGHNHPKVREAIAAALTEGTSFGAPTEREVEFAELLVSKIPCLELVRFVSSGTEATMSAVRLARGFTKRERIIKFNGCYHGHADSFLVRAGSGVATCGISGSPGVPDVLAELTLSIEFNDLKLLDSTLSEVGADSIAAIIVEPVPGNMGLVLPEPGFLEGLRERCTKHGIVLIFDEVMTGFRVAFGGAQERFRVQPDLSVFGKVIGGGLPVGAFGGKREILSTLAPIGPVYQAGTLSGNPLAMAAGLSTLKVLLEEDPYADFEKLGAQWVEGFTEVSKKRGVGIQAVACGAMIGIFFADTPVRSFHDAQNSNIELFKKFFHEMLGEGVYLAPSAYETYFISSKHSSELIEQTLAAADRALARIC